MARFLKQSFAQTCLKETDNGKLQQFNYSRGTVEREKIHSARAMKQNLLVNCINLIIEMSPRIVLGRENVQCVAEVVNRSLKADCTDFTADKSYCLERLHGLSAHTTVETLKWK